MTIDHICVILLFGFAAEMAVAAPVSVKVASHGQTSVSVTANKLLVQVKIRTHEEEIGKQSDPPPKVIDSNCTYSRYPCSVVDRLEIIVKGVSLFVPRSAFCDLADLNTAEINTSTRGITLKLVGGDGAASFVVNIEFDANRVKRRTLAGGESGGKLSQDTTYHEVVFN